ncbi:MAG TPA: glycerophosphodiester phosphodiesterase family protein [Bdellovibrionales bacterium]|nr:glycerophosphodiester phosphodiesterase family protein [Bdellovibrionales bacterium]
MNAILRLLILTIGTVIFLAGASSMLRTCGHARQYEAKPHPLMREKQILIALRGGSKENPENTFKAFDHARAQGAWLHFDLRLTKDNKLVVMKDISLDRTTDTKGWLPEKTLEELKEIKAGREFGPNESEPIPTFEQMLERYKDTVMIVELQDNSLAAVNYIIEYIAKQNLQERVILASPHSGPLKETRALKPDWVTLSSPDEVERLALLTSLRLESIATINGDFLFSPLMLGRAPLLSEAMVRESHRRKKIIVASGIATEEEARQALELQVDGIATERPALLRGIIRSSSNP